MTDEEVLRLPADGRSTVDLEGEYSTIPDPEATSEKYVKRFDTRGERLKQVNGYRVVIPCCKCGHCVIVRELRMGQVVNTGFGCSCLRTDCDPFGTCNSSFISKRGPMVLLRKLQGGEKITDFKSLSGDTWSMEPPKEVPKAVLSGKQKVVPKNLNS